MIVVVGSPSARLEADGTVRAAGLAADVARAAVDAGAAVQLVGRIGEGPVGDGVVLDLTRSGIGHVASLRDATHPTPLVQGDRQTETGPDDADLGGALVAEPIDDAETAWPTEPDDGQAAAPPPAALDAGDLDLALGYLREFRAIVLAEPIESEATALVAATAAWSETTVVALIPSGETSPAGLETATVLEAPAHDPDGAFAGLVGRFVSGLDRGEPTEAAFRAATRQTGWETATG